MAAFCNNPQKIARDLFFAPTQRNKRSGHKTGLLYSQSRVLDSVGYTVATKTIAWYSRIYFYWCILNHLTNQNFPFVTRYGWWRHWQRCADNENKVLALINKCLMLNDANELSVADHLFTVLQVFFSSEARSKTCKMFDEWNKRSYTEPRTFACL